MRRKCFDGNFVDEEVLKSEGLVPARKRRRTIVDAFKSISLAENEGSARLNTQDFNSVSASGTDDFMIDADDDVDDSDVDEKPLTTNEIAEREIMRALAFGQRPYGKVQRHDPVEQKLQDLIRGSIRDAIKNESQCDMDIEASYNRPSPGMDHVDLRPRSNSLPDEFPSEDTDMDITPL